MRVVHKNNTEWKEKTYASLRANSIVTNNILRLIINLVL